MAPHKKNAPAYQNIPIIYAQTTALERHIMLGPTATPNCTEIGFTIPAYKRTLKSNAPDKNEILQALEQYLHKGAHALRTLRPHTANHRWTACIGPLALYDQIFPSYENKKVIYDYLNDGLDLDPEGLWNEERSPNYNMVANWGMIYLADALNSKYYLEAAYKNLKLSLRLRQPNGEADTTFSHRQDRGNTNYTRWGEYYLCRRLSVEFNDGELAAAADFFGSFHICSKKNRSEFAGCDGSPKIVI